MGARQPDRMKIHGIDTVVIGEADELALDLFHDLEAGDAPELLHTFVRSIENIPMMQGPTVNSLIEAMRGCGRGCDFCDVNKRSKKDFPLARLQKEAKINLDYGFDSIWLDLTRCYFMVAITRTLFQMQMPSPSYGGCLKSTGARFVGTTHMTLSAVASSPDLIKKMSEINGMNVAGGRWIATNLGVETVAPRMVKKHLGVKTKPFQPEEWGAVVREGSKILNQNNWFPALTLIIGWPDETPDETQYTIDLIEDFRRMNMRGLVAPLLYQDFSEKNSMHFGNLNEAQFTLFWRCWEHNLPRNKRHYTDHNQEQDIRPSNEGLHGRAYQIWHLGDHEISEGALKGIVQWTSPRRHSRAILAQTVCDGYDAVTALALFMVDS